MQEQGGNGGAFFFNVNVVFLSQIAIYGLAFGLRVVLARGLGDEGLGTYSLFFVAVLVAGGIANLGVGLGNIYFLNKRTYSYGVLLSGSLFVLIAASAVAGRAGRLLGARRLGGVLCRRGPAGARAGAPARGGAGSACATALGCAEGAGPLRRPGADSEPGPALQLP